MGKKSDVSDFECGMAVGARHTGLSISETADLLGFSRTTISGVYRKWSGKEEISSKRQLCGQKCFVDARGQSRMGRLVRAKRKATTQITTLINEVCRRESLKAQHIKPWSRWAAAAEQHTGCHSCQLRTGNWGYNSHNRRLEKSCLVWKVSISAVTFGW